MGLSQVGYSQIHWRRISFVYKCDVWLPYHVFRDPYSVIQTSLGPHLATVDDVDVDGESAHRPGASCTRTSWSRPVKFSHSGAALHRNGECGSWVCLALQKEACREQSGTFSAFHFKDGKHVGNSLPTSKRPS